MHHEDGSTHHDDERLPRRGGSTPFLDHGFAPGAGFSPAVQRTRVPSVQGKTLAPTRSNY